MPEQPEQRVRRGCLFIVGLLGIAVAVNFFSTGWSANTPALTIAFALAVIAGIVLFRVTR